MFARVSCFVATVLLLGTAPVGLRAVSFQHTPAQPKSGQPVIITARLGTGAGISKATLFVQVVEPGNYVRRTDAAYTNSWRELPLHDDGREGDAKENDGVFAALIPGDWQQHRRLIRYYVARVGPDGGVTRFPAATNDCPNFAYFVSDGLPAWTGASQPGKSPLLTFPSEFMDTLPAYQLIARREDVEQSQWDGGANKKRFPGTMIYDGRVYDHIQFHNRGKASTHVSGKNKWGFKFNDAQPFHDRDLWGRALTNEFKSVSLTACASPWAPVNRGLAGMDEAVSFRAYQLAGVPSASTHWIQLRVIARTNEVSTRSQYSGDLWGLYQVVQEPNGEWLRERGLPDGDIYSPETGVKHRAHDGVTNDVAFQKFMSRSQGGATEGWWRTNLDLPRYYTFHALNRVLSNVDVRPGANHYLYHEADGRWAVVPWDLDMMFIAKTHQPGYVDQARCLEVPALKREYQNRAREVLDLFCADAGSSGGQIGQLVDELARFLTPARRGTNEPRSWPELDMALWNHHPRSNARGQFYVTPYRDGRMGGEWTRTLATPDFAGFCQYLVDFCTDSRPEKNYAPNDGDQRGYGYGHLWWESRDEKIPARPVIQKTGEFHREASYKFKLFGRGSEKRASEHTLFLHVSPFTPAPRATNSVFAAVQWRLGEISAPGLPGYQPGTPRKYEIEELWRSAELPTATNSYALPLAACQTGHTYRARARYLDNSGRWSHWSEPVQFVGK